MTRTILFSITLLLAAAAPSVAQAQHGEHDMKEHAAASLAWAALEVPGFDTGMKLAVLQGNPEEAAPYVVRLSFPAGYRFPPHWHPMAENLTVISGTFLLAMGETVDTAALKRYGPGDYLYIAPRSSHFGGADAATVIQLHGTGPFTINLTQAGTD